MLAWIFNGDRRWRRHGAGLLCVLLAAACRAPQPVPSPAGGADPASTLTNRDVPADSPDGSLPEVRLDALRGGAAPPGGNARNPFRLDAAARSPMLGGDVPGEGGVVPPGEVEGWQPAAEAAAIRFLGILEAPESAGLVGVLADGGGVYHGRVDDVVGGRYRIVSLDRTTMVIERIEDGERRTLRPSGH